VMRHGSPVSSIDQKLELGWPFTQGLRADKLCVGRPWKRKWIGMKPTRIVGEERNCVFRCEDGQWGRLFTAVSARHTRLFLNAHRNSSFRPFRAFPKVRYENLTSAVKKILSGPPGGRPHAVRVSIRQWRFLKSELSAHPEATHVI